MKKNHAKNYYSRQRAEPRPRADWWYGGGSGGAFNTDTTEDGEQAIFFIGDSNVVGSGAGAGTTCDPATVYQVSRGTFTIDGGVLSPITPGTLEITEVTDEDIDYSTNRSGAGSMCPAFGNHYNAATGFKPIIFNWGIPGTEFSDWIRSTTYNDGTPLFPIIKAEFDELLVNKRLLRPKAIIVGLGINDYETEESEFQDDMDEFYTTLIAAYPNTPIYVIQVGRSTRISTELTKLRSRIRAKVLSIPQLIMCGDMQSLHSNGYFIDAVHTGTTGLNELGKMISRGIINNDAGYSKLANTFISSNYSDITTAKKLRWQQFANTIEDYYPDLYEIAVFRQDENKSVRTDYAFLHGLQWLNAFFAEDNAVVMLTTTQHMKSGVHPSITLPAESVDDVFAMIQFRAVPGGSNAPDATAGLFGTDDGTSAFKIDQTTANDEIQGRANTISTDEAEENTENFIADNAYGVRVQGTLLTLTKNGFDFSTAETVAGAQNAANGEIMFGGVITSGTVGNIRPIVTRYFVAGKASAVNNMKIFAALENLVGDSTVDLDSYLVGHWPLTTRDGSFVTPELISGNNGTFVDGTLVANGGPDGEDVYFLNGSTQYISVLDNLAYSFGNGTTDDLFTWDFWVKPSNITTQNMMLLTKRASGSQYEYQVRIEQTTGKILVGLFDNLTVDRIQKTTGTGVVKVGVWNRITITWDASGTVGGLKVYINKVLSTGDADISAGTYVAMNNGTSNIAFGTSVWSPPSEELFGTLFDIKMYKGIAMTQEQINSLL